MAQDTLNNQTAAPGLPQVGPTPVGVTVGVGETPTDKWVIITLYTVTGQDVYFLNVGTALEVAKGLEQAASNAASKLTLPPPTKLHL